MIDTYRVFILSLVVLTIALVAYKKFIKKDSTYSIFNSFQDASFISYFTVIVYAIILAIQEQKYSVEGVLSKIDFGTEALLIVMGLIAAYHLVFESDESKWNGNGKKYSKK